jgi:hypothetical protein
MGAGDGWAAYFSRRGQSGGREDHRVFDWHVFAPQGSLLLLAAVLMIVAERKQWRPSLLVVVVVALALRGEMALVSYNIQPYDTFHYFFEVGRRVLAHQDLLNHKNDNPSLPGAMVSSGWSYLPVYAWPLGGMYWIAKHGILPWYLASKLAPIGADTVVAVLVGKLTHPGNNPALRRFQYACNPAAILISSVHGQVEPFCLMFAAAAALALRRQRPVAAGILLGLAIGSKTWPALFLPALLLGADSARARIKITVGAVAVPVLLFLTMPITTGAAWSNLGSDAKVMEGYRSITGTWGWTAVLDKIRGIAPDPLFGQKLSPEQHRVGTMLMLLAVVIVLWRWRSADSVTLMACLGSAFLVVTSGFGAQYLVWPMPFQTARPNRWTVPFHLVAGAYAGFGYLVLSQSGRLYTDYASSWYVASAAVIAVLIGCMATTQPGPRRTRPSRAAHRLAPAATHGQS